MTDAEYIEQLQNAFSNMHSVTSMGTDVGYRTEKVLPRTFELKFDEPNLEGYCSFTVSLRNIGQHHTLKVVAHTYDGTKIATQVYKDLDIKDAISAIDLMCIDMYEDIVNTGKAIDEFRSAVTKAFTGLGYDTQCNSKYMLGFATKKKSVLVTITAAGTFSATLKYIHSNRNSDRQLFKTSGIVSLKTAEQLTATFGAL